jgi:hypothetical protein
MKLNIFIVLALCFMTFSANGLVFYSLERFLEFRETFVTVPAINIPPYTWWTPYYTPSIPGWVPPLAADYVNTAGALGGQRDQILGFEVVSDPGVSAILGSRPAQGGNGGCYYTLGFVGGGYWQWDGIDNVGVGAQPAKANVNPGIGSNSNYVYLPAHNAGGQTIDLTLGGAVGVFAWEANTDLDCEYTWDFFDANNRTAKYTVPIAESTLYLPYRIFFSDRASAEITPGWAGFSSIAAIQLAVYTFQSETNAIDTEFRNLQFVGYEIIGDVVGDCDCVSSNGVDEDIAGQTVTIRSGVGTTPSGTVLGSAVTDQFGRFVITGAFLVDGSFQVCLENPLPGYLLCTGQTVCRRVDLSGFIDPPAIGFVVRQNQVLIPPDDTGIECDDCDLATTACTGVATLISCEGGTVEVTAHTDVVTNTNCVRTITRTFNGGAAGTVTQRITISDNDPPRLITPAQNQSPPCTNLNPTFNQWLANFGGATWDDCSSFTVTNDAGGGIQNCGARTVTFTASDPCGNGNSQTSAVYSLIDTVPPQFTTEAVDASAPCDLNGGSDFAAFNAWLARNADAVATDNCGIPTITNNYTPGSIVRSCNGQTTVTFTATDSCGLTDVTVGRFTITDNQGPTITVGASAITSPCDGTQDSRFQTWLNNNGNAVAVDSCTASNLLTWSDNFFGSTVPTGCNLPTTVTFTVFDSCFESSSTVGTFTVIDNTPPTVTNPTPLSINCDQDPGNSLSTWLNNNGGATAVDACTTNVVWSNNFNSLGNINCGSTTVTFTACDLCATPNCRSVSTTFSIVDQQAPTYITPPLDSSAECNSQSQSIFQSWLAGNAGAILDDNCSPDNIVITNNFSGNPPFGCFSVRTVTFNARDACGNSAPQRTATFTVSDNVAPQITTPAQRSVVECNQSTNQGAYNTWLANRGNAIATDACATTVQWVNNGPATVGLTTGCSVTYTVTFTATDGCLNEQPTTAEFVIQDNIAPRITTQASNRNAECNDQSANVQNWLNDNGGARAADDCTPVTWSNNFIALSGGCSDSAAVVFTARDSCGNSATSAATFSINDTQPPVIVTPARSTTVNCGPGVDSALATFLNTNGGAFADDACQGTETLVWTNNFNSAIVGCGFRAVTFTVTDPCGRSSATTASFTIIDTSEPVFDPAPQNLSIECDESVGIDYNVWVSGNGGAFATDECALVLTYSNNAPPTGPQRCESVTVTFTVEDECNNFASATATFSVVDTQLPFFTIPPQDLIVECDGTLSVNIMNNWLDNFAGATALDICTPAAELLYSSSTTQAPVRDVCLSSTMYTFNVVDSCGNTARDTAAFIIRDTTAPMITVNPSPASFECDGSGNINQITNWINTNGGAVAQDACQSSIDWTNNYPGQGPFTCQSILVTFTASDECGHSVSRSASLAIEDNSDPEFMNVPRDLTLPCDAETDPDILGFPTAIDSCAGELIVFYTDSESDLPPLGNCPGNHLILRTFQAIDECANTNQVSQLITVVIARSSGPCDPGDCDCECCPPAAPSQCLPSNCQSTNCRPVPCSSSVCTCVESSQTNSVTVRNVEPSENDFKQCKPVYIYVNDDDDDNNDFKEAGLSQQRILVSDQLIDRFVNKSGASSVFVPFIFVLLSLFFVLF